MCIIIRAAPIFVIIFIFVRNVTGFSISLGFRSPNMISANDMSLLINSHAPPLPGECSERNPLRFSWVRCPIINSCKAIISGEYFVTSSFILSLFAKNPLQFHCSIMLLDVISEDYQRKSGVSYLDFNLGSLVESDPVDLEWTRVSMGLDL